MSERNMGVSFSVFSLNPEARAWLDEIGFAYGQQVLSRDPTFDDVRKILKHFEGFETQVSGDEDGFWVSVEYKKVEVWLMATLEWYAHGGPCPSGSFRKPSLELALEMIWRLSALTGPLVFLFEALPVIISGDQTFDQVLEAVAVVYPWVENTSPFLPSDMPRLDAQKPT
jgi:hypothetical protein